MKFFTQEKLILITFDSLSLFVLGLLFHIKFSLLNPSLPV